MKKEILFPAPKRMFEVSPNHADIKWVDGVYPGSQIPIAGERLERTNQLSSRAPRLCINGFPF
jgi:hypothetical protein